MEEINKITILDTSICSENIGDKIIMDSALKEINSVFNDSFYVHIPTHDIISKPSYIHLSTSKYKILCGTNLLSSNMDTYNQWKINLFDSDYIDDITLLGVGWWQYQNKPNLYTKMLLRKVLSKDKIHSVRDAYTKKMLNCIGINNVINTSCPTMWELTKAHCKLIRVSKAKNVIFTLTDYNRDKINDKILIETLIKNYDKVFFWVQAYDDVKYLSSIINLSKSNIIFVPPTIKNLDEILVNEDVDYIGTRLHAGIRALQKKVRTIIIGVDNRAQEKARDFNLGVLKRSEIKDKLIDLIFSNIICEINIPEDNINLWKNQFLNSKQK